MDAGISDVHPNAYVISGTPYTFGLEKAFAFYWEPSLENQQPNGTYKIAHNAVLRVARAPSSDKYSTTTYVPDLTKEMQQALTLEAKKDGMQVHFEQIMYWKFQEQGPLDAAGMTLCLP